MNCISLPAEGELTFLPLSSWIQWATRIVEETAWAQTLGQVPKLSATWEVLRGAALQINEKQAAR